MLSRALFPATLLLLMACSDGGSPDLAEFGSFSATLGGVRAGQLAGPANAGLASTELGEQYAIRMFATHGDKVSFVTLICPGGSPIAVGTFRLGPGETCEGRYGVAESQGFAIIELAIADRGSMTVSLSSQDEIDGSFSFQGPLVENADTVGTVSARGGFRAVRID